MTHTQLPPAPAGGGALATYYMLAGLVRRCDDMIQTISEVRAVPQEERTDAQAALLRKRSSQCDARWWRAGRAIALYRMLVLGQRHDPDHTPPAPGDNGWGDVTAFGQVMGRWAGVHGGRAVLATAQAVQPFLPEEYRSDFGETARLDVERILASSEPQPTGAPTLRVIAG